MPNLIKLRLNDNQLEEFPSDVLIELPQLEELELKGNKLTNLLDDIPESQYMDIFHHLKHLDLSQNKFEHMPKFISYLPRLRVLFMSYNKINNIDNLFNEYVEKLEILDVSNNKIKNISDEICYLDKLEHLNLEYNDIVNVPTVIGFMPSIKKLNLYGNPIKNIRNDIIMKGPKYILESLKTKHPGKFIPPQKMENRRMIAEKPSNEPQEDDQEIKNYKVTEINPHIKNPPKENINNNIQMGNMGGHQ
eukprot:CAMPEP_0114576516 /NCGR_PEP_ID=MMETSP0125-20121206/1264_1 /TAXON_ID=485358 ORGANISM="Aristerostoma sp., Strain ATCC 50986" /NCGR_SAMPLE_ID=MMETSP0125 /ASSEMBLY_ACC=CAM_ASM_000245 /LENGTH=247 /DNA_ID=CAMNT_0001765081 /DNA_START=1240 /DNA_END=1983 /DNA_ORIENTATION=-